MQENPTAETSAGRPHWSPNQYRPQQKYTYKFTPNGELRIHVSFPFDWTPRDRRPGAVFFFGGGWNTGVLHQFSRHAAYLAGRGMVAASADYRVKSRHEATPADGVEDAKSAIRWVRAHAGGLGIDADRIVAGGGSAGGHLAACAAMTDGLDAPGEDLSVSARPNALVLYNPAVHFDAEQAGRLGLSTELAERISPLRHVGPQTPPCILFFGTADRFLPWGQQFVQACRDSGVRAEIHTAEGQPHGFFNHDPWFKRTLRETDRFLVSLGYLTGEPDPDCGH